MESIYGIALYDPNDGKIIHMHTILNMEGASSVDPQTKEKELEYDVTKLSILHAPDLKDISAQYYVNVKEKTLVKIPETEILKRLKESQE